MWQKRATARMALSLAIALPCTSTVWATNYVVDALNGDDAGTGISATGGPGDLSSLDFSNAFKTIAAATSLTLPGDAIFVNTGQYTETIVPSASSTLIALGEVIITNPGGTGFVINDVPNVVINGFTITNCSIGVLAIFRNAGVELTNLTIRRCERGIYVQLSATVVMRRCIITDCSTFGILTDGTVPTFTADQCTVVANQLGVSLTGTGQMFRNNIVAFNSVGILESFGGALVDFNNVFGNTTDYKGLEAGPNDLSLDPRFIDLPRRILHLQPDSPLINAGEGLGGGPAMTIGARDAGQVSSQVFGGWAGWIDESNALLSSGLSTLVEIDPGTGHIVLKEGVTRAAVRSPVYTGSLKSVEFAAVEDVSSLSGSRSVIDQVDATSQRELRFRGSNSAFNATDLLPEFSTILEGQVSESSFGFVQVELTLTRNGL